MKRPIALALMILLANPPRASALDADKAAYVGGTISSYTAIDKPIEGRLSLGPAQLAFAPDNRPPGAEHLSIDYSSIHGLEFGQAAGRRGPLIAGAFVLLGPFGLPAVSAKHRAHYLTLVYADSRGQHQVVVMELGKDMVRTTLAALEERSGIPIEYQDDEARKWRR
jgi:hypothetical protein